MITKSTLLPLKALIILGVVCILAGPLVAQERGEITEEIQQQIAESPLENELYQEAERLKEEALEKIEEGDYQRSIDLSERSIELSIQARRLAAERYVALRAHAFRRRTAAAIEAAARSRNTTEEQQALLADARSYYDDGLALLEQEQYQNSTVAFQDALALLEIADVAIPQRQLVLPAEYEVRLIPEDRDTLNKISGYPFVYGDRFEWRELYEANRERLRDPDNPHLIFPDQVFVIPSMSGEIREGRWDPTIEYPSLQEIKSNGDQMKKDDGMMDDDMEDESMKDDGMMDDDMEDESMKDDGMMDDDMEDESMKDDGMMDDDMEDESMKDDENMEDDDMKTESATEGEGS